jgi:hypothetical protein
LHLAQAQWPEICFFRNQSPPRAASGVRQGTARAISAPGPNFKAKDLSMQVEPVSGEDGETDRQADAMKVQLRKDVDAWTKARREPSRGISVEPGATVEPSATADKPVPAPRVGRAVRAAAAPPAGRTPGAPSKPFTMSYGGETPKDYVKYMIARGVR